MKLPIVKYFMQNKKRTSQDLFYKQFLDDDINIRHESRGLLYIINEKEKTMVVNKKDKSNKTWLAWAKEKEYKVFKGEKYETR